MAVLMGWFFSERSPEQIKADIAARVAEENRRAARSKLQAWWEDQARVCIVIGLLASIPLTFFVFALIGMASVFG